jgi:KRAB domain-containing zinc finger protein
LCFYCAVTVAAKVKCKLCDKLFETERYMKKHLAIHTAKRSFPCKHCNYAARRKTELVLHMRTHTGEKPFSCDLCTEVFMWKSGLIRHKRYAHLIFDSFVCEICKKDYSTLTYLRVHQKQRHSGILSLFLSLV